jgi:hypothetical protein
MSAGRTQLQAAVDRLADAIDSMPAPMRGPAYRDLANILHQYAARAATVIALHQPRDANKELP